MFRLIPSGYVGVIERFNRFVRVAPPGLNLTIPFVERVHYLNTQLNNMPMKIDVRTKDSAFSKIHLSVQYRVSNDYEKAYYALREAGRQIPAYVEDILRSEVSKRKLSELFEDKNGLAKQVSEHIDPKLRSHGYILEDTLVTDIEPDPSLRDAMNKVLASDRLKEAATNEAQAARIRIVEEAEANKVKQRLHGEGIAAMRAAIMNGYSDSMSKMAISLKVDNEAAMRTALYIQHLDTLERMAATSNAKVIFAPNQPGSAANSQPVLLNV